MDAARAQRHAALVAAAATVPRDEGEGERSSFQNGVSAHRFARALTLVQAAALLRAAGDDGPKVFVGTLGGKVVVSLSFVHSKASKPPTAPAHGKRRRDDDLDKAADALRKVRAAAVDDAAVSEEMCDAAQDAVHRVLQLRSASGESVLESYGVAARSEPAAPALVLSARLAPGTAVSLGALLRALGPRAGQDGMLTTRDAGEFHAAFRLPLSSEAEVVRREGGAALTVFAAVQREVA